MIVDAEYQSEEDPLRRGDTLVKGLSNFGLELVEVGLVQFGIALLLDQRFEDRPLEDVSDPRGEFDVTQLVLGDETLIRRSSNIFPSAYQRMTGGLQSSLFSDIDRADNVTSRII